jgi:hypothetical protein
MAPMETKGKDSVSEVPGKELGGGGKRDIGDRMGGPQLSVLLGSTRSWTRGPVQQKSCLSCNIHSTSIVWILSSYATLKAEQQRLRTFDVVRAHLSLVQSTMGCHC